MLGVAYIAAVAVLAVGWLTTIWAGFVLAAILVVLARFIWVTR
jgi:hypothetical protein